MVHKKDAIFWHSLQYPFTWCGPFCCKCWLKKPPSGWLKFYDSQSEACNQWFLNLSLATKQNTPFERVWKNVPENGVFSFVLFCFRSFGRSERCGMFFITLHFKHKWSAVSATTFHIGWPFHGTLQLLGHMLRPPLPQPFAGQRGRPRLPQFLSMTLTLQ